MNIELKKIKIASSLSEETIAFTADIYVDGVCCGYASNHGHGGSTMYHALPNEKSRKLIEQAEAHCKALPLATLSFKDEGGDDVLVEQSLESVIDDIVEEENNKAELKKHHAKMQKACGTAIIVTNDKAGYFFKAYYWAKTVNGKKIHAPISLMLSKQKADVEKALSIAISKLKQDEYVFNPELKDMVAELTKDKATIQTK